MQHLVVRYAKRGKMRFASHRDLARVFERGVRRAGLPIAYSAGFTPHPRISYAGGAPTGVASEAEYLSLALTSRQAAAQALEQVGLTPRAAHYPKQLSGGEQQSVAIASSFAGRGSSGG